MRDLDGELTLELLTGDNPALVLAQGERRVRVDLPHVKAAVADPTDAAAQWSICWRHLRKGEEV